MDSVEIKPKLVEAPFQMLKMSYEKMKADFMSLHEQKSNLENIMKYQANKAEQNAYLQKKHFQGLIDDLNKKLEVLEMKCKNHEEEENEKNRREIRKFVQSINQKDAQINSLKRQIASLKSKITSYQHEINNLTNTKDNFELFVFKSFEQIKTLMKQQRSFLQEIQTEKMVLQSKFKQQKEKLNLLENQKYEVEAKKNTIEQNYQRLKVLYKSTCEDCLNLKFQISKLKENNSFTKEYGNDFKTRDEEEQDKLLIKELQSIAELNEVLGDCESYLQQSYEFCQMNKQLIKQNNSLKEQISKFKLQIDELKCKYVSGFQDQYLRTRQPSLYDYLLQKKNKYQEFQKNIEIIENYIEQKDSQINQILKLMMEKQQYCSCGKQEQLNKLKSQLEETSVKLDSLNESLLKCRKQKTEFDQKIEVYRQQIKKLIAPQGKRAKKTIIRCAKCMLQIQKNQKSEVCSDCKKVLHIQRCSLQHNCGSFMQDDNLSVGQSQFLT